MSKASWRELDARANQGLTRFHNRTQWEPAYVDMPFSEMLLAERERESSLLGRYAKGEKLTDEELAILEETCDGDIDAAVIAAEAELDAPGTYELQQRMLGVKAFFRFMKARGVHPEAMLKQLAAAGRALHIEPFHAMTMGELGLMFGETKAAHSWRCKILSREIELTGMHGSKLPGQKSKEASESYREVSKGNSNRRKKTKPRQGSFLRKLHVAKQAEAAAAAQQHKDNKINGNGN